MGFIVIKSRHSCFQTVPSVECKLPGHTRYALTISFCLPSSVVQLHRPSASESNLSIRPLSLPDDPVRVPPGLYVVGKSSGEVYNYIFAFLSLVLNVNTTSWCICGQDVFKLSSWIPNMLTCRSLMASTKWWP